ncbi:hypothetical protein OAH73_04815 [Planktomarina sp.]|nr:hypothetical protein [Planktomarina sp.]MDA8817498.1 hypothetical protein [Planktomarina sp.]MDB4841877.1 hypothetical protein [Planktomarina sp.]
MYQKYQKNIILITCLFLPFGCSNKTDLNNNADAASIEKQNETSPPKGITFKKNADGKYVLFEGSSFNSGKKEADKVGLPASTDRGAIDENTKKPGLADVFANLWTENEKNDELSDQNLEPSQADVSSSEIETVSEKRKSMLEQFTTITWPWEKK